jgi:hypothetical protein
MAALDWPRTRVAASAAAMDTKNRRLFVCAMDPLILGFGIAAGAPTS